MDAYEKNCNEIRDLVREYADLWVQFVKGNSSISNADMRADVMLKLYKFAEPPQ